MEIGLAVFAIGAGLGAPSDKVTSDFIAAIGFCAIATFALPAIAASGGWDAVTGGIGSFPESLIWIILSDFSLLR